MIAVLLVLFIVSLPVLLIVAIAGAPVILAIILAVAAGAIVFFVANAVLGLGAFGLRRYEMAKSRISGPRAHDKVTKVSSATK
ncbi:MAG: hypothetical protein ACLP0J_17285 [Solirubrobacteraceae bacterium]